MQIKINIDVPTRGLPSKTQMKAWLKYCLQHVQLDADLHVDCVSVSVMQALNLEYRKKNAPTNVLSFPECIPLPKGKQFLGNIILCPEVLMQEALQQGKAPHDHFTHLLIHGCLHLIGFDHQKKTDAVKMEALEIKLLSALGIHNPYE